VLRAGPVVGAKLPSRLSARNDATDPSFNRREFDPSGLSQSLRWSFIGNGNKLTYCLSLTRMLVPMRPFTVDPGHPANNVSPNSMGVTASSPYIGPSSAGVVPSPRKRVGGHRRTRVPTARSWSVCNPTSSCQTGPLPSAGDADDPDRLHGPVRPRCHRHCRAARLRDREKKHKRLQPRGREYRCPGERRTAP
jgi:hypothetical protein